MPSAFLVTSGEYSNYGVDAVFSTRELAEAYIDGRSGYEVETFDLDPHADDILAGRRLFTIYIKSDGTVINHWNGWGDEQPIEVRYRFARPPTVSVNEGFIDHREYYLKICVRASTLEQAIKAANEQRAQWIAAGNKFPADGPHRVLGVKEVWVDGRWQPVTA